MHRKRRGQLTLLDPDLFRFPHFRLGITQQTLQQITLGGAMIVLPIFLQLKLEYNAMQAGLCLAPLSLSMFAVAILASRRAGKRRPSSMIRMGFLLATVGMLLLIPLVPRADFGRALVIPLMIAGCGLGLLVSQLNNYTLAPIEEERVSEAAGVNSAAGSFGLSFGLAVAGGLMLASLSATFGSLADSSTVLAPDQQDRVAEVLEDDAQVMSDTQLTALLTEQPDEIQDEILSINDDGPRSGAAGGVARAGSRQPHRARQLLPDDAPPGHHTGGPGRGGGLGLTYWTQEAPAQVAKALSRVARSVSVAGRRVVGRGCVAEQVGVLGGVVGEVVVLADDDRAAGRCTSGCTWWSRCGPSATSGCCRWRRRRSTRSTWWSCGSRRSSDSPSSARRVRRAARRRPPRSIVGSRSR